MMKRVLSIFLFGVIMLHSTETYRVYGVNSSDTLSLRSKPSSDSKKIGELPYNFFGLGIDKCIEVTKGNNWCKIANKMGWVSKKYIEKSNATSQQEEAYRDKLYQVIKHKENEYLNLRKGIGSEYEVLGELPYNSKNIFIQSCLQRKGRSSWCYVIKFPDETSGIMLGWLSSNYISEIKKESVADIQKKEKKLQNIQEYNQKALNAYSNREYQDAIAYYKKSLVLTKEIFGEKHRETALSYQDLAVLFTNIGDYERSEQYFDMAMNITAEVCTPDDILYIQLIANYANLKGNTGQYKEAQAYYDVLITTP